MFVSNKIGIIPDKTKVSINNKSYKSVTRKQMKTEFLELHRKYPNDYDLGEYLRHEYIKDLNADPTIVKMIRETPNDYALGKVVRGMFINS